MKPSIISLFLICLFPSFTLAQSGAVQQLENQLQHAQGKDYVQLSLKISEQYKSEGDLVEAYRKAEKAYIAAEGLNDKEMMAKAYLLQAKIFMEQDFDAHYKEAEAKLSSSKKLLKKSDDKELKLAVLKQLKQIAERTNNDKELAKIEKEMVETKASNDSDGLLGGLFNRKKQLEAVEDKAADLSAKVDTLAERQRKMEEEREMLAEVLAVREQEIVSMSEQQAKSALLIAKQKNIVDSLNFAKTLDAVELERQQLELSQKDYQLKQQEAEAGLQRSQRNLLLALAAIGFLIAIGLYMRYQGTKEHNKILQVKNEMILAEQNRSDQLLLNILPAAIAHELKQKGGVEASYFEHVTVLFTDFKNFSKIAEDLSPGELVRDLDYCFKKFDAIIGKHGLEKIKTIGDAYMCAGGLPTPNATHPQNVIQAALEIQHFLRDWKVERTAAGKPFFEARVGIHSGPIVAGVVGDKKFAYDIWGDTVNIAARMESSGEAGMVNISKTTYEIIKDQFECKYRGKIPAKNLGEIDMYFVG